MKDFMHSRRLFLQRGMTMLSATATIPLFLDNTAHALADPADPVRSPETGVDGKILVIIQLSGGNDGLNTVVPWADDAYHRARPTLGVKPNDVLKIDDYLGLHPTLAPVKELFDNGEMSIVQGVGYPNPNRSHFRSMDIWHTANPDDDRNLSGWLGRYFDNCCSGADPVTAVNLGETEPLAMKAERFSALTFDRPDAFRYRGKDAGVFTKLNEVGSAGAATAGATKNPSAEDQISFLARTALDAQTSSDRIRAAAASHRTSVDYPRSSFAQDLRTVSAMITAGMPTRVYYVGLGGFDTHAGQAGRHENLLSTFSQGVAAFWKDLKEQKNAERVLVMTFSEFGRRVAQNASGGTDHGAAAPMFLFGERVRQGVVRRHPSLTDLDAGDLKHNIDFRSIYASVLQNWLDVPSKPILGRQFETMKIVKG